MKLVTTFRLVGVVALSGAIFTTLATAQTVPEQLDDPGDNQALVDLAADEGSEAEEEKSGEDKAEEPASATAVTPTDAAQETADEGIQIQVEKSSSVSGAADHAGAVKIYSPWPAKPISPAPAGWKFVPAPAGLKPYRTTVTLGSGSRVDLSITPFVLVPLSDGQNAIRIAEPGYDPALHYAQKATIGTMLKKSTAELEENEKHAADVISRLQQLLSSLPQQ